MARLQFLQYDEVRPTLEAHFLVQMPLTLSVFELSRMWEWAEGRYGYRSAITVLSKDQHPRNYCFDPNRQFAAWTDKVYFMTDTDAMLFKMTLG